MAALLHGNPHISRRSEAKQTDDTPFLSVTVNPFSRYDYDWMMQTD